MSDPATHRKSPGLLWLFAPFILFGLILAAMTIAWWTIRLRIEDGLSQQTSTLARQGYVLRAGHLAFSGYPYRMAVSTDHFGLATPSRWAVDIRGLKAEAMVFDPGHWVFVASQGLVITRPEGGDVIVSGHTLRASLTGLDHPVPSIALEGVGLTFSTPAGARPFSLAAASRLEFYTRTGLKDASSAEALLRLEDATISPASRLSPLIGGHRLTSALSMRLTHFDALRGKDWTIAGQNWAQAGGKVTIDPTAPPFTDLELAPLGGDLAFGMDGKPKGAIAFEFKTTKSAVTVPAPLTFSKDETLLGDIRLGPPPRLF